MKTNKRRIKCFPNPILREKSRWVLSFGQETKEIVEKLKDIVDDDDSMVESEGLAAIQIGCPKNIILVEMDNKERRIFVNLHIKKFLGKKLVATEGCLSIPGIMAKLKCRHDKIKVRFQNEDGGAFVEEVFEGREAVVVQHEHDHCNGILLFDRMDPVQKRMKKMKYRKAPRKTDIKIKKITRSIR